MRRARNPSPDLGKRRGTILPDVNVLVHAHNADSVVHSRARRWWDECLSGPEGVGPAWATLLGFGSFSGSGGHRIDDAADFGHSVRRKTTEPGVLMDRSFAIREVDAEGLICHDE